MPSVGFEPGDVQSGGRVVPAEPVILPAEVQVKDRAIALVGPVVNPFNTSRFDFIGLNGMLPMVHCRPALFCLDVAFFELVPAQGAGLDEAGDFASVANTGYDRYGGQTGGLGEEAGVSDGPVRVALVGGP